MQFLIRAAHIIDAHSTVNGQVCDLLIENGLIRQIGQQLSVPVDIDVVKGENLHVSAGWVDMRVSGMDPGFEHREDITSVCRTAAAGGFTDIALLPNTQPVIDSKDTLGYVRRMAQGQPVSVHTIAAVTKKTDGADFADMLDLHHAGAVAFSDGHRPLQNPDLLLKTLQYLQPIGGLLMNRPEEAMLTRFGQMHEGVQSTLLGMKGIPALAEELSVERDLRLLEYVGVTRAEARPERQQSTDQFVCRVADAQGGLPPALQPALHFSTISTARSVELIRQAKARGMAVSCDVAAHQLVFDDSALAGFDTNFKVNPPFRSPDDVTALWAGLADGTIDAIVSDHLPQDSESKQIEFDHAEFGIIGLETAVAAVLTHNRGLSLAQLVDKLTTRPRYILRLPTVTIAEGQPARLSIFDPAGSWTYQQTHSKSRNSPFFGQQLTGRVIGTVHQGQFIANS